MEIEFLSSSTLWTSHLVFCHIVIFYHPVLSMPESIASLMKEKKQAVDSLSDTGYSFEYVPTPVAAGGVGTV